MVDGHPLYTERCGVPRYRIKDPALIWDFRRAHPGAAGQAPGAWRRPLEWGYCYVHGLINAMASINKKQMT